MEIRKNGNKINIDGCRCAKTQTMAEISGLVRTPTTDKKTLRCNVSTNI